MTHVHQSIVSVMLRFQDGKTVYQRKYDECVNELRNNVYFKFLGSCVDVCANLGDFYHVTYYWACKKHTKSLLQKSGN